MGTSADETDGVLLKYYMVATKTNGVAGFL